MSNAVLDKPLELIPSTVALPGWPIVRPGLLMQHVGPVLIVICDGHNSDATYALHLAELARAIDLRTAQDAVATVYHVVNPAGGSQRYKALGEMLAKRSDILRRTTKAYAMCTASAVVRASLRTIFFFAPPPYPNAVVKTAFHAYDFVSRQMSAIDPSYYLAVHQGLFARFESASFADTARSAS